MQKVTAAYSNSIRNGYGFKYNTGLALYDGIVPAIL
jgi:hypothetical protein